MDIAMLWERLQRELAATVHNLDAYRSELLADGQGTPFEVADLLDALRRLDEALAVPANGDDPELANWFNDTLADVRMVELLLADADDAPRRSPGELADRLDARTVQRCAQIDSLSGSQPSAVAAEWTATARSLNENARRATLERQLDSVRISATEARETVETIRQVAGTGANVALTAAYEEHGKGQARAANWFQLFAIISLLISTAVVVASTVYGIRSSTSVNTGEVVQHVSVALAFLALFGYLARMASQHRDLARWSAVMVVQLKTFDAFSEDMSAEDRRELRAYFGRRVFCDVPGSGLKTGDTATAPTVQMLLDLTKAIDTKR